ncbi:SUKH-4 family immunity protein [Micromonospora sp. NPDC047074]|uniref:SUKH-4 family immunity protein n=1 Tax=Micromonospora sp. NPDC047074 TaxID=3154339 RepID=UPI0033D76A95
MPTDDATIEAALARILPLRDRLPYPGTWLASPRVDGAVVVLAEDTGLSRLLVDPATDTVCLVDDDGSEPVNATVDAFAACAEAFVQAQVAAAALPEDADDDLEAVGERLADRFREIDPVSVAHENRFWSLAAEELGYGMI